MIFLIILAVVFLGIDIVSKIIVSNLMNVQDSIMVINDFFYITYVRNTGAAWSMFAGKTWLLIIVSIIIIRRYYIDRWINWIEKRKKEAELKEENV